MSFTCVGNVELGRLRVDHDNALMNYTLAEFAAQGRAWECRASQSTRRPIRAQYVAVRAVAVHIGPYLSPSISDHIYRYGPIWTATRALKRVETIVTREWWRRSRRQRQGVTRNIGGSPQRKCQKKHVTSRRFTHGMALLL